MKSTILKFSIVTLYSIKLGQSGFYLQNSKFLIIEDLQKSSTTYHWKNTNILE